MPVALPFVDSAKRQIGVSLTVETLNRIDAQRLLEGIPSRSAMIAELVELGLQLRENPMQVAHALVDALEATLTDDTETASTV
jgi:metal-responsive CopG/Arc/MetJ family transcriptional regulator